MRQVHGGTARAGALLVTASVQMRSGLRGRRYARALRSEPFAPEAAHVLNQRQERAPLLGERVLDTRRDLGVSLALHDALVLEGPKAKRERARADAGERALELAEAAAAG